MLSGKLAACRDAVTATDTTNSSFRMSQDLSREFFRSQQADWASVPSGRSCIIWIWTHHHRRRPRAYHRRWSQASVVDTTDRQWAIGLHLSALLGFAGPHLLNVVGPLVIWLIKKNDSAYLDSVGKRVMNFQISYSLYGFAAITLFGLLWWLVIGLVFLPIYAVVGVAWLILTIVGAVKESNGETYEYPFVIKFFQ